MIKLDAFMTDHWSGVHSCCQEHLRLHGSVVTWIRWGGKWVHII